MPSNFTNNYFQSNVAPLGQVNRTSISGGGLGQISSVPESGSLSGLSSGHDPQHHLNAPNVGDMVTNFLSRYRDDEAYRGRVDGMIGGQLSNYLSSGFAERNGINIADYTFQPGTTAAPQMGPQSQVAQAVPQFATARDQPVPNSPPQISSAASQAINAAPRRISNAVSQTPLRRPSTRANSVVSSIGSGIAAFSPTKFFNPDSGGGGNK